MGLQHRFELGHDARASAAWRRILAVNSLYKAGDKRVDEIMFQGAHDLRVC
jgi:hypothetical protein